MALIYVHNTSGISMSGSYIDFWSETSATDFLTQIYVQTRLETDAGVIVSSKSQYDADSMYVRVSGNRFYLGTPGYRYRTVGYHAATPPPGFSLPPAMSKYTYTSYRTY